MRAERSVELTGGSTPVATRLRAAATRMVADVSRSARRHRLGVDAVLAVVLAALAIWGVRYVQLAVEAQRADIASARDVARAALASGGQTAVDARRFLDELERPLLRLPVPVLYGLALLVTLPLTVRRRWPLTVGVVVVSAFAVGVWFSPTDASVPSIGAWLALYSVAAFGPAGRRRLVLAGVLTVPALLLSSGVVRNPDFPATFALRDLAFGMALAVTLYASAVAFGETTRRHRAAVAAFRDQARLLEVQRDELARTAVLDERVRIARELHDVVAHHVSVMGMQAGASRLSLGGADPRVSAALATIEESSRQAISDLQRLVGFLRSAPDDRSVATPTTAPQPHLGRLGELIDDSRSAGMAIDVVVEGEIDRVPDGVGLTAYRIVQEALTNARKHGARHAASVAVVIGAETVSLRIENPHRGSPSAPGGAPPATGTGQHGLVGMRERVALHGGTIAIGPDGDGSFVVDAVIPLQRAAGHQ